MKIAYLCDISPLEAWSYSSGNARIYAALEQQGAQVDIITNSWGPLELLRKTIHQLPTSINWRTRWRLHLLLSRLVSGTVTKALRNDHYDVLFCPYSFQSLANLKLPYPMLKVFSSDATPTAYKRSEIGAEFGSFLSISRLLDPAILQAETKVFQANDLNIWPSEWQKNQADKIYKLDDKKSVVIPWGANIADPGKDNRYCHPPTAQNVQLLLVGRDWFAKGGPLAFETLQTLRNGGVNAHLTVIGCTPPDFHRSDAMTVYPSLDKNNKSELAKFETEYKRAHFFVMPSYESFGFAFCEASAYGLPSIALRIGGVPILEGINGHTLPSDATALDIANCIRYYLDKPAKYTALSASSRGYYESTLNWGAWGKTVIDLFESKISDQ